MLIVAAIIVFLGLLLVSGSLVKIVGLGVTALEMWVDEKRSERRDRTAEQSREDEYEAFLTNCVRQAESRYDYNASRHLIDLGDSFSYKHVTRALREGFLTKVKGSKGTFQIVSYGE